MNYRLHDSAFYIMDKLEEYRNIFPVYFKNDKYEKPIYAYIRNGSFDGFFVLKDDGYYHLHTVITDSNYGFKTRFKSEKGCNELYVIPRPFSLKRDIKFLMRLFKNPKSVNSGKYSLYSWHTQQKQVMRAISLYFKTGWIPLGSGWDSIPCLMVWLDSYTSFLNNKLKLRL